MWPSSPTPTRARSSCGGSPATIVSSSASCCAASARSGAHHAGDARATEARPPVPAAASTPAQSSNRHRLEERRARRSRRVDACPVDRERGQHGQERRSDRTTGQRHDEPPAFLDRVRRSRQEFCREHELDSWHIPDDYVGTSHGHAHPPPTRRPASVGPGLPHSR